MRTAAAAVLLLFSLACGGAHPEFVGHFREQVSLPGTGYELMLTGTGTTISGSGILHREAGQDTTFTVSGSTSPLPGHGVTFDYGNGVTEGFTFAQPDNDHIDLTDAQGKVHHFARVVP